MGREFTEQKTCDSLKRDIERAEADVVTKEAQLHEARESLSSLRRELRGKCAYETQGSHHFITPTGRGSEVCLVCGEQMNPAGRIYIDYRLLNNQQPRGPRVINLEWRNTHSLGGPSNRDRTA